MGKTKYSELQSAALSDQLITVFLQFEYIL